jgi:16S rRNA (adenine1518-N6/adenine1519-N6)-dimethyltransferase
MKIEELKARMQEIEVRAKRSFGQNFLISEAVIGKIVTAVKAGQPVQLIEIGPGMGALTEPLADLHPLLIELDRDLAEFWRNRGFNVVEQDALKVQWEKLAHNNTWLVSNLPYQISTHLVVDMSFGPAAIAGMILMFQKEVAQRLVAAPRTSSYGLLSIVAQSFWNLSRVTDASPRDFYPAPRVASRVLKFKRMPSVDLDRGFLSFVKVAFAQRRKLLLKNLSALSHKKGLVWEEALEGLSISQRARAEELDPEQFRRLYRLWKGA